MISHIIDGTSCITSSQVVHAMGIEPTNTFHAILKILASQTTLSYSFAFTTKYFSTFSTTTATHHAHTLYNIQVSFPRFRKLACFGEGLIFNRFGGYFVSLGNIRIMEVVGFGCFGLECCW